MLPDDAQTTFDLIGVRPILIDRLGRDAILLPGLMILGGVMTWLQRRRHG